MSTIENSSNNINVVMPKRFTNSVGRPNEDNIELKHESSIET
jgi:hypothetical protein